MDPLASPDNAPQRRYIDVGGYHLAMQKAGAGWPTVVIEPGSGRSSAEWQEIVASVARVTRVVSYDRAGLGESEPAPTPRTFADQVADLHALLRAADISPPYVLVGHWLGGLLSLLYAHSYPREVAGMVLIDSAHPNQGRRTAALLPRPSADDSPRLHGMRSRLSGGYEPDPIWNPEGLNIAASEMQVQSLRSLDNRPLAVLTTRDPGDPPPDLPADFMAACEVMYQELQQDLARWSIRGTHVIAEHSRHRMHLDAPGLVIDTILQVVAAVRGQG